MQTIAIIGAGFSGAMVAAHLLRRPPSGPTTIVLVERTGAGVGGVAYGTTSPSHVLNVPAGRMSAFDDDPGHFLRWAQRRDGSVTGGSFVPRMTYRQYLADLLDESTAAARPDVRLLRVAAEATLVRPVDGGAPTSTRIEFADGGQIIADRTLLAIGNLPPADPPFASAEFRRGPHYARDAWGGDALDVAADQPVLLLGTGLTMLDMALALRDRGHQAPIYALSRRGLLPQAHRESATPPPAFERPSDLDRWPASATGMCRALRAHVKAAAARGIDWREVVTSIRHDTPALWRRLGHDERRRFLRRLRPYWETHRHRSAPATDRVIQGMIASRQLRVIAGHLVAVREQRQDVELAIAQRVPGSHAGEKRGERRVHDPRPTLLHVGKVINCTGPNTDIATVEDPLMRNLHRLGLIRPDALGLGIDSDERGAVIDAHGRASERLFIVGPLRKGSLWENTAVPELRVESKAMAQRLAALHPGRTSNDAEAVSRVMTSPHPAT